MHMHNTAKSIMLFLQNIIGLIPLALILGEITEDLAVRFGPTVGGLLNATFGNVVELILSIVALTKGLYTVVASSLVGSILSNLLLVLGMLTPTPCQHLSSFASCSLECIIPTAVHHPYVHASSPSLAHHGASSPPQCIIPIIAHHPHHITSSPSKCLVPTIACHPHQSVFPSQRIIPIKAWDERPQSQASPVFFFLQAAVS